MLGSDLRVGELFGSALHLRERLGLFAGLGQLSFGAAKLFLVTFGSAVQLRLLLQLAGAAQAALGDLLADLGLAGLANRRGQSLLVLLVDRVIRESGPGQEVAKPRHARGGRRRNPAPLRVEPHDPVHLALAEAVIVGQLQRLHRPAGGGACRGLAGSVPRLATD